MDRKALPDLKFKILKANLDDSDCVEGLRLVADSVAQQRQIAAASIIQNPIILSTLVLVIALLLSVGQVDLPRLATTCAGLVMAGLVGVRWLVSGYIAAAEKIDAAWLAQSTMILCKFGQEIIGTTIVDSTDRRLVIRAWTVKLRYRHKNIGFGLLEEAIGLAQQREVSIEFASTHANSLRVLPGFLNRAMDKQEARARTRLRELSGAS